MMTSGLALDALPAGRSVFTSGKDLNSLSSVVRVADKIIRNARTHARVGNAWNMERSVSTFRGKAGGMAPASKRSA